MKKYRLCGILFHLTLKGGGVEMLKELLTLNFKFSESHLVFPRITTNILIFLGALILISNIYKKYKAGTLTQFRFKFFKEGFDKFKFFGTMGLLVGYVLMLERIGFLTSSIVFVFLATMLFYGNLQKKTIIISIVNSLATSYIIWFIFGKLINITLP